MCSFKFKMWLGSLFWLQVTQFDTHGATFCPRTQKGIHKLPAWRTIVHFTVACLVVKPLNRRGTQDDLVMIKMSLLSYVNQFVGKIPDFSCHRNQEKLKEVRAISLEDLITLLKPKSYIFINISNKMFSPKLKKDIKEVSFYKNCGAESVGRAQNCN